MSACVCLPLFEFGGLTRGWASEVRPGSCSQPRGSTVGAGTLAGSFTLSRPHSLHRMCVFFLLHSPPPPFLFICLTIAPLYLRTLVTSEYLYLHHQTYAKFFAVPICRFRNLHENPYLFSTRTDCSSMLSLSSLFSLCIHSVKLVADLSQLNLEDTLSC